MRTLIRNATCVFPEETVRAHVLLDGTRIAAVDAPATARADEIVEAAGLHLLPGVIDDHVHFREPGATHKEDLRTGSLACAKGGVTTFLEMPNTVPPTTDRRRLAEKLARAAACCAVNYGFFLGATPGNLGELQAAERTPGIKVFLGASTGDLLVDDAEAQERIFAGTTLPIAAHCEDEATIRANAARLGGGRVVADHSRIRDHEAARRATRRAVELAHRHRRRLHVLHVSTAAELEVLRDHRRLVTAEVCPHHLFFSTADYARLGTRGQMNPSLKEREDTEALWAALAAGAIQVVATDHAPHTLAEKARPYPESPSGVPAVENALALMLDAVRRGRLTLRQLVERMCDAPARVWDLAGKGRIAAGYDADLVAVDLEREHTLRDAEQVTRCGWTPWDGVTLVGLPVRTWVMGRLVCAEGRLDESVRGREVVFAHDRGGYWA
ncbi:MAG: dihydroorotase [Planctomycetes bacterium]|nr:dihydroorotase [Planctomycetota bacterium]